MPDFSLADVCGQTPPAALYAGIAEFNRGEYFECHETLEHLWMREPGAIRRLYQGILQVGVGFYHLRNGNYRGTLNLLGSGVGYLTDFKSGCYGVDVARLITDAFRVRHAVLALGPDGFRSFDLPTLPQIHYDPRIAAQAVAEQPTPCAPTATPGHW